MRKGGKREGRKRVGGERGRVGEEREGERGEGRGQNKREGKMEGRREAVKRQRGMRGKAPPTHTDPCTHTH